MKRQYFVTGTDTEVGKTVSSVALLKAAAQQSMRTIGLKPVAAGSETLNGECVNEDAIALQQAATIALPYAQVNPVLLEAATSPHIAAHLEGRQVTAARIEGICRGALMQSHDFAVVEGAGGWRVPLSHRETMADLAKRLGFPVIIVVGLKLGCINHALLTAEAVQGDGLRIAGWIANTPSEQAMAYQDEYLATLKAAMPAPCIGHIPYQADLPRQHDAAAYALDLSCLLL